MSGWIILTRNLYKMGGGPARCQQFDEGATSRPWEDMKLARERGMMVRVGRDHPRQAFRHKLTELGEAFCEGRARIDLDGKRIIVRYIVGATVPDDMIERAMAAAGQQPGAEITRAVLKAFSAGLAAEIRAAVTA